MYKLTLILSLCALLGCTSTKTADKDAAAPTAAAYHVIYHEDGAGALKTTLLGPTGEVMGSRAGLLMAGPDGALRVVEVRGVPLTACAGCAQDDECPSSVGAEVMTLASAGLDGGAAATFRPKQAPKESIDKASYKSAMRVHGVHDGRIFVRFDQEEYLCGSAGAHGEGHDLVVTADGAPVELWSQSLEQREEAATARRAELMAQVKAAHPEASDEHVTLSFYAAWPDWRGAKPVWRERYVGLCQEVCGAMVDEAVSLDVALEALKPPAPLTFAPAVQARWEAVAAGRGLGWAAVSAEAIGPALEGFK